MVASAKSAALVPEMLTLEMFIGMGSPPVLVTVAERTPLVVPQI